MRCERERVTWRLAIAISSLLTLVLPPTVLASENVPHRPFAYWTELPEPRQFILGFVYEESEAYHIWAKPLLHRNGTC